MQEKLVRQQNCCNALYNNFLNVKSSPLQQLAISLKMQRSMATSMLKTSSSSGVVSRPAAALTSIFFWIWDFKHKKDSAKHKHNFTTMWKMVHLWELQVANDEFIFKITSTKVRRGKRNWKVKECKNWFWHYLEKVRP